MTVSAYPHETKRSFDAPTLAEAHRKADAWTRRQPAGPGGISHERYPTATGWRVVVHLLCTGPPNGGCCDPAEWVMVAPLERAT